MGMGFYIIINFMEQNYLPLFRKYRPQSFKDIVGQESLVKALTNAIELNRIANAYLFCGPRGTGKTSSARILAKSLNCEHGPTTEPCQKCASCIDITNAQGLDVIEIDAASNRGIQDAKELINQVQYAPIHGKYKIFIIDEVHMLSNDAFNALLKTFEEPPKNVIFILATTEPHKVLETIVSRCQRFDLRRITTQDIVKRLREISDIENIKITQEALYTIAKNVSGGLRDSLALLDQVSILGVKEEISKDLIEELLGKINFDTLLNLLKEIYNQDTQMALICVDEIYSKGNEPRNLAENFIEFLRNVILVLNSNNLENIKNFSSLIDEDIEKIKALNFDKDKIFKILNTIIEYYKEIKVSTNPYLWMELAAIGASRLDLTINQVQNIKPVMPNPKIAAINMQAPIEQPKPVERQIEKPIEKPINKEPKIEQKPTQAPEPIKETPIEKPQIDNIQLKDGAQIWMDIISHIPSMPARAFYKGVAKLVKVENQTITLGFLNENTLVQAKSPSKMPQLENAIKALGVDYKIEFIRIDENTKVIEIKPSFARPQVQAQPYTQQTVQSNQQNPIKENQPKEGEEKEQMSENEKKQYSHKVQEMIEQFKGRIID